MSQNNFCQILSAAVHIAPPSPSFYVVNVGSDGRYECREPARNRVEGRLSCRSAVAS